MCVCACVCVHVCTCVHVCVCMCVCNGNIVAEESNFGVAKVVVCEW